MVKARLLAQHGCTNIASMTYPRAHLVDVKNGGYYHCTSRCVRRAWLCGNDPVSGNSYDHRKQWLEAKILRLARHFAVDLYAYAIMSNHYHVIVHTAPKRTAAWSAEEVAKRWLSRHGAHTRARMKEKVNELVAQPQRIQMLRKRLGSLSWFMRDINESLARIANAEDECTGRFWEGRFKSVALLDRSAIVNCMIYVELNPARANSKTSIPSAHTSARMRSLQRSKGLATLGSLELSLSNYLELIRWTHQRIEKKQSKTPAPQSTLSKLGQSEEQWLKHMAAHSAWYRAYGMQESIEAYLKKLKQKWIQMPMLRSTRAATT